MPLKTAPEIERLRVAAEAIELVLRELCPFVKPDVTTGDLEQVTILALKRHGLEPVLQGLSGYPGVVCTSVNNVAAHGIPGPYRLQTGDLVSVDVSGDRGGWKADAAWTYGVGPLRPAYRRLLRAAWRATMAGALAARAGARLGDVGAAVLREARLHGCSVVSEFTGHGIGTGLHEPPAVVHVGEAGTGEPIVPGMVLNIEPVLTLGDPGVVRLDDGWSYATADGRASAQFEVTVAVRGDRTDVLTLSRYPQALASGYPPYG